MAKVVLIGLNRSAENQLGRALSGDRHEVKCQSGESPLDDALKADIVFADGAGKRYMPLLRELRNARPDIPFVVVTGKSETSDWLDALEAGVTDYCAAPFDTRHIHSLLESALHIPRVFAA